MQSHSINDHLQFGTPPQEYIDLGDRDNLTPGARWTKEESIIKQVLCSTLPDTAFNWIKNAATVKDAWDVLKRVYEERSKALVADVICRFRNKCCEENESMRSHFESLTDLREQLAAMGKAVTDDDYTDTLLASLSTSYDSSVSSISASVHLGSKTLTAEIFEQLIIDEYERRKVKDKRENIKDEALSADSGKKKGKDKKNIECFNCKKKGHYKSECYAKGGGNEGGGPLRWGKGDKDDAAPAEDKTEPEAWATIVDAQEPTEEPWPNVAATAAGSIPAQAERAPSTTKLYDSGASRHMSPYHEHFVLYQEIPPRAITAADKRVFYAAGTGDLEIEVPHGTSFTPIILKDVLHALKMGTTIVSVNRITKAGYTVTFKNDTCQIRNKSDKVIGSIPVSQNGLYKVERVYAAATCEERIDLVTLHRHLAHIAPDAI